MTPLDDVACHMMCETCPLCLLCWWDEVDCMSALKPSSSSCLAVCGDVLVHVVYMTLCLSGFRAVVSTPSLVSASGLVAVS